MLLTEVVEAGADEKMADRLGTAGSWRGCWGCRGCGGPPEVAGAAMVRSALGAGKGDTTLTGMGRRVHRRGIAGVGAVQVAAKR